MIAWTIYVTFGAAILLLACPGRFARWIALGATVAAGVISFKAFCDPAADPATYTTIVNLPWIPSLGMHYHLASDGISLALVLVTSLTGVSAVLFSWAVPERRNEFFFWLLMVVGGSYGVFLSADLFLFFAVHLLDHRFCHEWSAGEREGHRSRSPRAG